MSRRGMMMFVGIAILVLGACVTINVYFPEAEIENLSEKIEEAVARQAEQQSAEPGAEPGSGEAGSDDSGAESGGGEQSRRPPRPGLLDGLFGVSVAYAAEIEDPGVSNPAIRKIIDSRARRVDALGRFKDAGAIGEGNDGLLHPRDLSAIDDLRERARAQKLIREENEDRRALYREIAKAKNVDPSQVPRVAATYAETLRERAKPGHWIQLPDGQWKRK